MIYLVTGLDLTYSHHSTVHIYLRRSTESNGCFDTTQKPWIQLDTKTKKQQAPQKKTNKQNKKQKIRLRNLLGSSLLGPVLPSRVTQLRCTGRERTFTFGPFRRPPVLVS